MFLYKNWYSITVLWHCYNNPDFLEFAAILFLNEIFTNWYQNRFIIERTIGFSNSEISENLRESRQLSVSFSVISICMWQHRNFMIYKNGAQKILATASSPQIFAPVTLWMTAESFILARWQRRRYLSRQLLSDLSRRGVWGGRPTL